MRNLFTSLCLTLLFALGAGGAWAQTYSYEKTEKRLSVEALTSGKLVTIQARDTNNSVFFSGASSLPSSFQQDGSTVYRIKMHRIVDFPIGCHKEEKILKMTKVHLSFLIRWTLRMLQDFLHWIKNSR